MSLKMSPSNCKHLVLYVLLSLSHSAVKGQQADGNIDRLLEPLQDLQLGINVRQEDNISGALGPIMDRIWE